MTTQTRPPTLSQALLNLGRIRAIEDSINFGLLGFYKAENHDELHEEEIVEMKKYLRIFEEFCHQFEVIVSFEQENDARARESLERWVTKRGKTERMSRIDTLIGVRAVFTLEERRDRARDFQALCITTKSVLKKGKVEVARIKESQRVLEELREKLRAKLDAQRRTSEKIISGRVPSIYYGSRR